MEQPDFNQLLEEYAAINEYIDNEEEKLKGPKTVRDKIKAALMACMNTLKIDNAKTHAGHAVCIVSGSSAKVVDGEAFFEFVIENGRTDMLTRRCSVEAIQEYLDVNNQLPPGIEFVKANTLRFTRAK